MTLDDLLHELLCLRSAGYERPEFTMSLVDDHTVDVRFRVEHGDRYTVTRKQVSMVEVSHARISVLDYETGRLRETLLNTENRIKVARAQGKATP